ncbi:MAG: hypothetical protein M3430_09280 [Acidobacteriota bacterium]|nr:hypothetical protein [Acidobacteriota bacterium]
MAETIKREIGVETELIEGGRGEFTVWVGDRVVAQKGWIKFPSDQKVLAAVRQALGT